jgi:hypothetical protein
VVVVVKQDFIFAVIIAMWQRAVTIFRGYMPGRSFVMKCLNFVILFLLAVFCVGPVFVPGTGDSSEAINLGVEADVVFQQMENEHRLMILPSVDLFAVEEIGNVENVELLFMADYDNGFYREVVAADKICTSGYSVQLDPNRQTPANESDGRKFI